MRLIGLCLILSTVATARDHRQDAAWKLVREYRYRDAAAEFTRVLSRLPATSKDRTSVENSRNLFDALSSFPPQTASVNQGSVQGHRNELDTLNVPLEINGQKLDWIFDAGANISTIAESEARKIGLTILDSTATVAGSTGAKNPLRVAMAKELILGDARIQNVIFLVIPDQSLYIAPISYQMRGLLGLPVIRALGRVQMDPSGLVRFGPSVPAKPNLTFEGLAPIAELQFMGKRRRLLADTGANTTLLEASFVRGLKVATEKKTFSTGGAGGTVTTESRHLPAPELVFPGGKVTLKDIPVNDGKPAFQTPRDGTLGMDALWGGYIIDFGSMQLSLPTTRR